MLAATTWAQTEAAQQHCIEAITREVDGLALRLESAHSLMSMKMSEVSLHMLASTTSAQTEAAQQHCIEALTREVDGLASRLESAKNLAAVRVWLPQPSQTVCVASVPSSEGGRSSEYAQKTDLQRSSQGGKTPHTDTNCSVWGAEATGPESGVQCGRDCTVCRQNYEALRKAIQHCRTAALAASQDIVSLQQQYRASAAGDDLLLDLLHSSTQGRQPAQSVLPSSFAMRFGLVIRCGEGDSAAPSGPGSPGKPYLTCTAHLVLNGGPAHLAGMEEGDTILQIQDKAVQALAASNDGTDGRKQIAQAAEDEIKNFTRPCVSLELLVQKRGSPQAEKVVLHSRAVDDSAGSLEMFAVLAQLAESDSVLADEGARLCVLRAFSLLNKSLQSQDLQETYVRNRLLTNQRECLSALDTLGLILKTASTRSQQARARDLESDAQSEQMHDACVPGDNSTQAAGKGTDVFSDGCTHVDTGACTSAMLVGC